LVHAPERGDYRYLGATLDDSVGEAYDKVARELGLGYPGGPVLDRLSKEGSETRRFPRPMIDHGYDFSFAGLKTAVRYELMRNRTERNDVIASFVAACMDVLTEKLLRAVRDFQPASAVVVGGVAASPVLRERIAREMPSGTRAIFPSLRYATDNAAMIGAAAWWELDTRGPSPVSSPVQSRLRLPTAAGQRA
jgi:N6-L-threonylcarbamoyladenine synthase